MQALVIDLPYNSRGIYYIFRKVEMCKGAESSVVE
jgi:hypothetical protein